MNSSKGYMLSEPPEQSVSTKMQNANDSEEDELISQAYDDFLCNRSNEKNKKGAVHSGQLLNKEMANKLEKEMEIIHGDFPVSLNNDGGVDCCNLITLDDLLGSVIEDNQLPIQPDENHDDDFSYASFISTIVVMDIFDRAVTVVKDREKNRLYMQKLVTGMFERAWKIIKPKSRWRVPDPTSWKINVAKKRRADGLPYSSKKKCLPPKVPKPVDCTNCKLSCTSNITEDDRMILCREYWKLDFTAKKNFLLKIIEVRPIKTMLVNRKRATRRKNTKKFYFITNGERKQVCSNFFQKTLCISASVITDAVNNQNHLGLYTKDMDPRGRHEPPNKLPEEKRQEVRNHINSFPRMESHYIRKKIRRQYLDANLSLAKMYNLYVDDCKIQKTDPVSEPFYRKVFCTEFNLGFFLPKKDQCLICTKYERTNVENKESLKKEYEEHIARKEACNEEKRKDKERANKDKNFTSATFDLQSVLQIPSCEVGLLYYSRKLTIYNLCIYENGLPNEAYCFPWSELNGKKGSSEIGSILLMYLSEYVPPNVEEVAFFSDTCGGQNRNQYVAALLFWAVQKIEHIKIIEHKFLESGHSYMEVDSMHSSIECAKKNTSVYSMTEWVNIFRRARSTKKTKSKIQRPYNVRELKFSDFKDLKQLAESVMGNRAQNTEGNRVSWLKIKRMKYVKGEMKLYYNYDMSENFFSIDILPTNANGVSISVDRPVHHQYSTRKSKTLAVDDTVDVVRTRDSATLPAELSQLYHDSLSISKAKKADLLKLCTKGVISEEYHDWYRKLKSDTVTDRLPDVTVSDEDTSENE